MKRFYSYFKIYSATWIVIFLFQNIAAFGQSESDSLKKLLENKIQDTTRVIALNQLGMELLYTNTMDAEAYIRKALDISKNTQYKRGLASSLNNLASVEMSKSNYSKSEELYLSAIATWKKIGDTKKFHGSLDNLGLLYINSGKYEKSLELLSKSLTQWEKENNEAKIATVSNYLGKLYRAIDKDFQALEYYSKAYLISEKLSLDEEMLEAANGISRYWTKKGDYNNAEKYSSIALKLSIKLNNNARIASSYHALGNIYIYKNDCKTALTYYQLQEEAALKLQNQFDIAAAKFNIALSLSCMGNYSKAREIYKQCLNEFNTINDLSFKRDLYRNIYETDIALNDYSSAFKNYKQYITLRDSILSAENLKAFEESQIKYETEKKNHEIQLLSKKVENDNLLLENEKEKNRIFILLISVGLVTAFFILFLLKNRNKLKELKTQNYISDLRMRMVLLQINPHFYFNTLNNIYGNMLSEKVSSKSSELILKLSDLMRFLVDNSEKKEIPLEECVKFIEDYFALMIEKHGTKCNLVYNKNISNSKVLIAHYVVFPLIENAFKYGSETVDIFTIEIIISEENSKFELMVKNKIYHSNKLKSTGKGIDSIQNCLNFLYPGKHQLTLLNDHNEFIVNLKIELKNE